MQWSRWPLVAAWAALALGIGCRPPEPAEFTPGPDVRALTGDLEPDEDPEVVEMLEGLQAEIATLLNERTGTPQRIKMLGHPHVSEDHLKRGADIYAQYCVQCHGVNGDGNGELADYLNPRPRNYTAGIFKFVATENGSKARRSDLVSTLYRGVTGTSMPSFDEFPEQDLEAVADYVLALTYRGLLESELAQFAYDEEEMPKDETVDELVNEILEPWQAAHEEVVTPLSPMPPMSDETVARGKELFVKYSCHKCHGEDGRGSMFGDVDVGEDAWGYEASAADLTSGMFRGGGRPIDLYRRVLVGINGAPMPSRRADLADDPDAIWHIVHYIKDLGEKRRRETVQATAVGLRQIEGSAVRAESEETADSAGSTGSESESATGEPTASAGQRDGEEGEDEAGEAVAEEEAEETDDGDADESDASEPTSPDEAAVDGADDESSEQLPQEGQPEEAAAAA